VLGARPVARPDGPVQDFAMLRERGLESDPPGTGLRSAALLRLAQQQGWVI